MVFLTRCTVLCIIISVMKENNYNIDLLAELIVLFWDRRLRFVAFRVLFLTVFAWFRWVCKRYPFIV